MVRFLIIDFPQNLCGYDYCIICLLCGNYMSLDCFTLSTHIKATVCSIRQFNWQKMGLLFHPINLQLSLYNTQLASCPMPFALYKRLLKKLKI